MYTSQSRQNCWLHLGQHTCRLDSLPAQLYSHHQSHKFRRRFIRRLTKTGEILLATEAGSRRFAVRTGRHLVERGNGKEMVIRSGQMGRRDESEPADAAIRRKLAHAREAPGAGVPAPDLELFVAGTYGHDGFRSSLRKTHFDQVSNRVFSDCRRRGGVLLEQLSEMRLRPRQKKSYC